MINNNIRRFVVFVVVDDGFSLSLSLSFHFLCSLQCKKEISQNLDFAWLFFSTAISINDLNTNFDNNTK